MKSMLIKVGHTGWRLLPQDFRRIAMSSLAAGVARKPDGPPEVSDGIAVAGDINGANGLAETTRMLHQVIAGHGLARGLVPLGLPSVVPVNKTPIPPCAAVLAVVNAPYLPVALLRLDRDFLKHRRVIGMWAWELPVVPPQWKYGAQFVHEIWAPSPFTADAFAHLAPVRVVPYPLAAVDLPVSGTRATFGLPEDCLIVLTIFNLASSMVRKNPLGAIAAFKAAFGARRDCLFVLKISGCEAYQADLNTIKAAIGNAANIRLLTGTMPEAELRGLIAASDIVLSLHRSEGFGLIPAAAMLLGRPVVATGWSGNLAFMTPETSALVTYRLVPPADPRGVYRVAEALWADPDIEDAAQALRRLADDAALRQSLGAAGQAHAREALGAGPLLAALAANGIS